MRVKKNVQTTPTRTYCKRSRPLPYCIQIVGRPGTGSLPSTIAPPDHPLNSLKELFDTVELVGWLVVFGFNGRLRQYFSLYRAVSQREGERGERIDESKNAQTTPTRTYCKRNRPLPYCNPNCRTPRNWKLTQDHRSTRPPPTRLNKLEYFLS